MACRQLKFYMYLRANLLLVHFNIVLQTGWHRPSSFTFIPCIANAAGTTANGFVTDRLTDILFLGRTLRNRLAATAVMGSVGK